MCIITVIDTQPNVITNTDVKMITIANSLLGNVDGFGYYLFDEKIVNKSKDEASLFWRRHYRQFAEGKLCNGIYHTRKSSTNVYVKSGDLETNTSVTDDKSHPFNVNDIIVAHNGFLTYRYSHIDSKKFDKLLTTDMIDSQKYATVLGHTCTNGKVTFDNIKNSLNLFGGAYALAIKGTKDNFVWLVRGKDRTLFLMNIYSGDTKVGIVVNTTTYSQILLGELLADYGLDYEIEELKANTAYKYKLGSYKLTEMGEILQDSPFVSTTYSRNNAHVNDYTPIGRGRNTETHVNNDKTIYEDILEKMYSLNLLSSDLVILCELLFGKSLFTMDFEEFSALKALLNKLISEAHTSRINIWNEILKAKKTSTDKLYKTGIQYPYFMNTKEELKSLLTVITTVKEKKNELPLIQ